MVHHNLNIYRETISFTKQYNEPIQLVIKNLGEICCLRYQMFQKRIIKLRILPVFLLLYLPMVIPLTKRVTAIRGLLRIKRKLKVQQGKPASKNQAKNKKDCLNYVTDFFVKQRLVPIPEEKTIMISSFVDEDMMSRIMPRSLNKNIT